MPYEDDYKMWLEKMLIESNPDWVCDGMYDKEITRNWCVDYCGEDDEYITPRCLHMYYHHIARADRKTEPQRDCFLCKWLGEVDVCGRCRNRNLFAEADTEPKPKTEPTSSKMEQVDKDINVRSKDEPITQTKTQNSNLTFEKDECAKEYEELGLKELKELIEADRKTEQTERSE